MCADEAECDISMPNIVENVAPRVRNSTDTARRNIFQSKKIEKQILEYVEEGGFLKDDISCDCELKEGNNYGQNIICKNPTNECESPFKQEKKTKVFSLNNTQKGLQAAERIEKDAFIIEYVGEIIDEKKKQTRLNKIKEGRLYHGMTYFMNIKDTKFYIDAGNIEKANNARYVNSSCEPNAKIEVWFDGETRLPRVGIFALRDILADEELTYFYGKDFFTDEEPCACGSVKCVKPLNPNLNL